MPTPMLWKLTSAASDQVTDAGGFTAALRLHLQYTPTGLTSVLLQIKEEQSAYVLQAGCSGCATNRCLPGCRVDLLRRVLAVGYPRSELSLVKAGLLERPYTRMVLAWPGADAQPLDASVLQGWTPAWLRLHWRRSGPAHQQLRAGIVLAVGEGADDPRARLQAIGWHGVTASRAPRWLHRRMYHGYWWSQRPWHADPYLLTPVAAATHWLMTPPVRPSSMLTLEASASYAPAATIVHHLHAAGGRIEMLDLEDDDWTARVAATTAAGGEPRPVLEALHAARGPLEVRDIATSSVALDPAQARPAEDAPPLLFVGTRPNGLRRWRPLSATHHLVLSGPIEGSVILGMLAPAITSRGLRIGVLDLTATGTLGRALVDVPGRRPTIDARNLHELLGIIGSLADDAQLTVVVLAADDAAAAEAAMIPFLRAALYRPVAVLLVVPETGAIPESIQHRCPLIQVRQRVARWQVPEGTWEWTQPTVLRLPWRDPLAAWQVVPQHTTRRSAPLQPLAGFWDVPDAVRPTLGIAAYGSSNEQDTATVAPVPSGPVEPGLAGAHGPGDQVMPSLPASSVPGHEQVQAPVARGRRQSRVYNIPPGGTGSTNATMPPALSPADAPAPNTLPGAAEAPTSVATSTATAVRVQDVVVPAEHSPVDRAVVLPADASIPAPRLPPLPGAVPMPGTTAYTPQEDSAGNLIVDTRLLALTLRWAEQIGADERGVPMTRFKSALHLPSKAHSLQLLEALRLRGLIRREVREGWYRLLTLDEAVSAGKLPPGLWGNQPAVEQTLTALEQAEPQRANGAAVNVESGPEPAEQQGVAVAPGTAVAA